MKTTLPLLLLALALVTARAADPASAASSPLPSALKPSGNDIEIFSDRFDYDSQSGLAVYTGSVRSTDAQTEITCEAMTVKLATGTNAPSVLNTSPESPDQSGGGSRLESIVAENNVVITQGDRRATGQKAVYEYYVKAGITNDTVTLTGGPRIETTNSWMTADVMVFDRQNGKFRARGNVRSFSRGSGPTGLFNLPGTSQSK